MKRIFQYLKPYRTMAILSPILMMCEVLCDLLLPRMMSVIVDCGIIGKGDLSSAPWAEKVLRLIHGVGPYGSMEVIVTFGILMLVTVLIGGAFGISCAYCAAKASQGLGNDLRCDAYRRVMSLSIEQTDKFTTGSLVTRMTNDIAMVVDFTEMILRMFVRSPIFFIGGIIMLTTLNLSFGIILLCGLPIVAFVLFFVMRRAVSLFSGVQKRLDRVNSVVQENVSGARVVKAYVREDYERERFRKANEDLRDHNYHVLKIMAVMTPVLHIVMNLSIIVAIYVGGFSIEKIPGTNMTAGTLMAAVTYMTQIFMTMMMATMMSQSVTRAMASLSRIEEVLATEPVIRSGEACEGESDIAVSFRHVGFRYPNTTGEPVLSDVNLEVRRGEFVAIIGATGAGKSSLVNLIPRFYDATDGEILVDGVPVTDMELSALRKKIAFVLQKSELFSDTIENNLRWGDENADEERLHDAARIAQAEDFVLGFADGYKTYIAEKGASLSGGQKQRISIARALVRKPEILILDDATSALDLATEARLRSGLREVMRDSTVIMIAQRIASVRDADRIAVLENGTIRDCAPHDVLMKTSATYREIYQSQMQNGGAV